MRALLTTLALSLAAPALAIGTQDEAPTNPTATTTECEDGQIWDPKTETCVEPKESRFNDDQRFEAARELAFAERYQDALKVLATAQNPHDPRILNYTGYALRRSGQIEAAMDHYNQALAIDPDYILARSYMGQALIDQGDFAGAQAQLLEIRLRGGRDTWAYVSLKQALVGKTGY